MLLRVSAKDPKANPFAALDKLRDQLPSRPIEPTPSIAPKPPKAPARAVIRIERKGRSGKEATIVDKLGLSPKDLETWCRDLKQALGCGGSVDGEVIVLQGDLRPRLPQVLTAKGVGKVTVG